MKYLFYLLTATILLSASCEKQNNNTAQYYIRCKIDGLDYLPNNCANCMRGQILRDTVFLMNANAGFQTVGMGLYDGNGVSAKTYLLNGRPSGSADYKHSTTTNDIYKTDSTHIGELKITFIDKMNKILAGTFSFRAYNPVQTKTVNITNGEFRLQY